VSEERREKFHTCVAKLLFVMKRVRCDIALAVSFLCSRVQCTTEKDIRALTKVLKYLNGTRNRGVIFYVDGHVQLLGWGDASWMIDWLCRSRGCTILTRAGGVICVYASKLTILCRSSTEAELVNADDTCGKAMGLQRLTEGYGDKSDTIVIYQDNMSVMKMLKNGKPLSARTKHISMKYFSICEYIEKGKLVVEYMPTGDMLADIGTKPLVGKQFQKLRDELCPKIV
jgi:hypothetical protein